jgi:serine/threonine protein kinase
VFEIPPSDNALECLTRATVQSPTLPDVTYRIDRVLGGGGMSVAFLALRSWRDGAAPVVLKVMRPSIVQAGARTAALIFQKEIVALRRLAERAPATPFVVGLVEAGSLPVQQEKQTFELPWLGLEYVHGGIEGTTLDERIRYSITHTGFAFDPSRGAHALECMACGLDAIHEVGVIHRDLTTRNVLCCGSGEDEILKIADFGVARPAGLPATFGGVPIGTVGYSAPEQTLLDDQRIGPHSDVFSLAVVVYRMLTGEELFPARTAADCVMLVQDARRRSICESRWLSAELSNRPSTCAAVDAALARATSADPARRPPRAGLLAAELLPVLRAKFRRFRPARRHLDSIIHPSPPRALSGWQWTVRHAVGDDRTVRSVAWDGDGRCLAATSAGLTFWTGTGWEAVDMQGLPGGSSIRFVRRVGAGQWLVGGDEGTIAHYSSSGVSNVTRCSDATISFYDASGDIDDLAVVVGGRHQQPPVLYGLAARRWLKPILLSQAARVTALARVADERWLVVGRTPSDEGFVAVFSPLQWEVKRIKAPVARAYVACSSKPDLQLAVVVGSDGQALRLTADGTVDSVVPGQPDLSAVALDINGRAWATSTGVIWLQDSERGPDWSQAWADPAWTVPFVSMYADVGLVIAVTADGGIVEGRAE